MAPPLHVPAAIRSWRYFPQRRLLRYAHTAPRGASQDAALSAAAVPPSHPLAGRSCTPGSATLVLAGGAASGDNELGQDEWAICLPAFTLTVDAKCGIALTPAAAAAKLAINGGEAVSSAVLL